jgi:hypothetical protein
VTRDGVDGEEEVHEEVDEKVYVDAMHRNAPNDS